jgi:hypothetical protein
VRRIPAPRAKGVDSHLSPGASISGIAGYSDVVHTHRRTIRKSPAKPCRRSAWSSAVMHGQLIACSQPIDHRYPYVYVPRKFPSGVGISNYQIASSDDRTVFIIGEGNSIFHSRDAPGDFWCHFQLAFLSKEQDGHLQTLETVTVRIARHGRHADVMRLSWILKRPDRVPTVANERQGTNHRQRPAGGVEDPTAGRSIPLPLWITKTFYPRRTDSRRT